MLMAAMATNPNPAGSGYTSIAAAPKRGALATHLMGAFDSGFASDVCLSILGVDYRLHRVVLARSPVLHAMMAHQWKEKREERVTMSIDNPAITSAAVRTVLRSLYDDDDVEMAPIAGADCDALLAAATYFGADQLAGRIVHIKTATLDEHDVVAQACQCDAIDYGSHMRSACMTVLLKSASSDAVLRSQLHRLPRTMLVNLLSSDALCVPNEFARYQLCKSIAERFDTDESAAAIATKKAIRGVLCELRYATMSFAELMTVKADGIVDASVVTDALWHAQALRAWVVSAARLGVAAAGSATTTTTTKPPCCGRFAVTFPALDALPNNAIRRCDNVLELAGSAWSIEIRVSTGGAAAAQEKYLNLFLFRTHSGCADPYDARRCVCVRFRFLLAHAVPPSSLWVRTAIGDGFVAYPSSAGSFVELDHGWGWKAMFPFADLRANRFLSKDGAFRMAVSIDDVGEALSTVPKPGDPLSPATLGTGACEAPAAT